MYTRLLERRLLDFDEFMTVSPDVSAGKPFGGSPAKVREVRFRMIGDSLTVKG